MMTKAEAVKWLESLKQEIGKTENRSLWHYAEAIDMAIEAMSEPKTGEWIPVSDIRKLEDVVYMHIDSLEGTRNIVEAGMLSAWKEVAEYVDGMLGEDGEA